MANSNQLKISNELSKLIEQAYAFEALTQMVREVLPAQMQAKLLSASFKEKNLVCMVETSNWANKLRYFEQDILAVCTRSLPHLDVAQVKFRIVEPTIAPKVVPSNFQAPDQETANFMQNASQHLPEKLAEKLVRLSQLAKD